MNNQEPDLNPTSAETDSAKTNESVQREGSELPVDQRSSYLRSRQIALKSSALKVGTLAEAPKHALGAFLPDPCPCGLAALATQPFHPEANRYMSRSYHTGRDHPACDGFLRHAQVDKKRDARSRLLGISAIPPSILPGVARGP